MARLNKCNDKEGDQRVYTNGTLVVDKGTGPRDGALQKNND
jgi:hypothetical protein